MNPKSLLTLFIMFLLIINSYGQNSWINTNGNYFNLKNDKKIRYTLITDVFYLSNQNKSSTDIKNESTMSL